MTINSIMSNTRRVMCPYCRDENSQINYIILEVQSSNDYSTTFIGDCKCCGLTAEKLEYDYDVFDDEEEILPPHEYTYTMESDDDFTW